MISATKERLASFFLGTIQYEVPFFQRGYVWNEENWNTLWDHVVSALASNEGGKPTEHFIGTIITKQRQAERLGEQVHDLIDGQQRLTTVAVLLQAIADTSTGRVPRLKQVISENLRFHDSHNRVHPRIIPSSYDRKYFEAIIDGPESTALMNQDHRIIKAYRFFFDHLAEMADERRDLLHRVLLERVSVICMMLSHEDDEQEIFDTINALGVRLTTAELLKNYIFKDTAIQAKYEELWKDIYEGGEEEIEFWNDERTAGRIIRTNIEVLLYCYLVIKTGSEVKLESLFKEYKNWLGGKAGPERLDFLRELKQYAGIYSSFPSGPDLNEIGFNQWECRFFHVVENLVITTVLPLVLFIYKRVTVPTQQQAMLALLESFLVRRSVCRLTTKNYNVLFVQIINRLQAIEDHAFGAADLAQILAGFTEDTNRFPTDSEFQEAIHDERLSNPTSREILFLLALRQVSNGFSDIQKLSLGNYTVEHMMPVKWEERWKDNEMPPEEIANRSRRLKTLGNLTLVTGRLNSRLQNAAWQEKKVHLRRYASLPLTSDYLDLDLWDETAIEQRAFDLAKLARSIWPNSGGL